MAWGLRLKEAEEARTICMQIEGMECAGELITAMQQHSDAMAQLFRDIAKLTNENCDDEMAYEPLKQKATQWSAWFKSRKKVANSMRAAAK